MKRVAKKSKGDADSRRSQRLPWMLLTNWTKLLPQTAKQVGVVTLEKKGNFDQSATPARYSVASRVASHRKT